MKKCRECNENKDLAELCKDNNSLHGRKNLCKICHSRREKEWRDNNPEKAKAAKSKWYVKNKDKIKEYSSKYLKLNAKKVYEKTKKRKSEDPQKYKEIHNKANAKWKKENPGKWNAIAAKYRASKYRATPDWLNDQHWKEIEELYVLAQDLAWLNNGEVLAVDHIVPLQGENVSGLHVPWNLQLLTKSAKRKKKNKYEQQKA